MVNAGVRSSATRGLGPGLLLALSGSIAFSGKTIIVKLGYRYGVDAVTLIMLRMLFALPLFAAMGWWASRGQTALTRREWLSVVALGFSGYYLASFLDFWALVYITASLERLILYINPTLVMLLGWALFHRRPTRHQVAGMVISYSGVLLVFGHELLEPGSRGSDIGLGALLCLLSTVSYALYLIYSGELVRRIGSLRLAGLASCVACFCCLVQFLLLRPLDAALAVPPPVLWLSLLNATVCTAAPVLLVMMAIERIGPSATAQLGMVGPLSTIAMGVLILGESFTLWIAAGTVLVISGIMLFTRGAAR